MDLIAQSKVQHREMEAYLDRLHTDWLEADFAGAARLAAAHYLSEEPGLFAALRDAYPHMVEKMIAQHRESREIAEALESCHPQDRLYLYRRFWAITQHNIIEEERDFFPLAAATLSVGGPPSSQSPPAPAAP
jgi:hypothetical protein